MSRGPLGGWTMENRGTATVQSVLNNLMILIAEGDGGGAAPAQPQGGGNILTSPLLPMIIVIAAFFYFIIYLPSKRERARQAALWDSIKKNDRVLTTSGIYGVVTNVSKESNEVTLRIDESTNAKLRVTLNSIAQILGDAPPGDSSSK